MRTVSFVLAALCWMLTGLAFLWVFVLVFKPRATEADQLPATVMYWSGVAAGVASLGTALIARRRQSAPDPLLRSGMIVAALGVILPGLVVWMVMSAGGPEASAKLEEQRRRTAYHSEVEKPTSIALSGAELEQAWQQHREETDRQYQGKVVAITSSFFYIGKQDKVDAEFVSPEDLKALRFYMTPPTLAEWNKTARKLYTRSKELTLRCMYGGSIEEKGVFGGVHHYLLLLSCVR